MAFINIHTHSIPINNKEIEIYNRSLSSKKKIIPFSIGIHPWYIEKQKHSFQLAIIQENIEKNECLALGECGLDKNIKVDFKLQKEILIQQLNINKKFQKPVIIHCVKAFQEIILIKKKYYFPFIIHGFNKKKELAVQLLKNGFYLSFGEALLYKQTIQTTFKDLPLNKIFFETDESKTTIKDIYLKAAEIKNISLEELVITIKKNYKKVFNG